MHKFSIYAPQYTRARDFAIKFLCKDHESSKMLRRSYCGNVIFTVYEDQATKLRWIGTFALAKINDHWHLTFYTEIDQPPHFDCPNELLQMSNFDAPEAVAWRAKCAAFRENKSFLKTAIAKLKKGDQLKMVDNRVCTFDYGLANTQRKFVGMDENGIRWSYKINQISIESIKAVFLARTATSVPAT